MKLYLMRHGHAEGIGEGVGHDAERPLSSRGRADAAAAGSLLSQVEPALQHILTSPLTRAIETGTILGSRIPSSPHVARSEHLTPGFRQKDLLDAIFSLNSTAVLAIGHQPDMSMLLSFLISDSRAEIEMEAGALASVELEANSSHGGRLRWLLPPGLRHAISHA